MPITPFLRDQAFDPEIIEEMSRAFVKACASLRLSDLDDAATRLVAQHLIEAAQRGIRTDTALLLSAMQEFKPNPE